jgi:hypothetical protein
LHLLETNAGLSHSGADAPRPDTHCDDNQVRGLAAVQPKALDKSGQVKNEVQHQIQFALCNAVKPIAVEIVI